MISQCDAPRRFLGFGPIERRLFWIVLVGLLPLTLLSFFTLLKNAEAQRTRMLLAADATMINTVTAVDAELNASFAALDALATSPRVAGRDFAGFQLEAERLLTRRAHWVNIVLSDASTNQIMNARLRSSDPLPAHVHRGGIAEVIATGKAAVGNIGFNPVLNMHAFSVRTPIMSADKVEYVLNAVIDPSLVAEILGRQHYPQGSVVVVLDHANTVVGRSLSPQEWIGKPPSRTLRQIMQEGDEGAWKVTTTLEGVPVYTVFHTSPVTGWTAAIGLPTETLDSPIRRSYLMLGGSIVASILLGFAVAFLTGRTITRPILELEQAALAVGEGRAPTLPSTHLPEIRQVALALASAHSQRETLLGKEREARLHEQQARLVAEDASRAKDEFLAMLGHELRNPLAAITSAAQLLDHADRAKAAEASEQAKAIIRRQVQHLRRLTDDLLDAGRVIMGKIVLDPKPVDLAVVAKSAVETLYNTGAFKDRELKVDVHTAWVKGDPTRIEQVTANLLTNAAKYTPAGGTIFVSVAAHNSEAILRVRDTGIGIEPELLPRMFDLFVQGQRALDRSQGGLGIGLTLVRRLTELHGGRVEAHSTGVGKGSEFIVVLPLIGTPKSIETEPGTSISIKPLTIALVEDNADVRASLRKYLEFQGHHVHEAIDGPGGVELALRTRADVAIVDIGLPALDGYGVAQAIRLRADHSILLIAMSGYGHPEDVDRGLHAGFDAYLTKPIDHSALNQMLGANRVPPI
jgi:signal transduction histidine kinase